MRLTQFGELVHESWQRIQQWYPNIGLDRFVVMPNHLHGIIVLPDIPGRQVKKDAAMSGRGAVSVPAGLSGEVALGTIIARFKYTTTRACNYALKQPGRSIWQRNYYDHIIRNEEDLYRIRAYIATNPLKWHLDQYYRSND